MLSWVSGYRDPEVIRRKENMRRKRKHTHRYGMTEEEQKQALLRVKQITRGSESESADDFSSDYSPAEEDEVPEPDEPEVVDLLSDDYLDSDEDKKQPVRRKRKRLRQEEATTKKKKTRSRKPTVTKKVTQHDSPTNATPSQDKVDEPQPSAAKSEARTKSAPIEESDDEATGNSGHPIDLASSGDETGDSDKGGTLKTADLPVSTSHVDHKDTKKSEMAVESTILRLKVPKNFKSPQNILQNDDNPTRMQKTQVSQANAGTSSEKTSSSGVEPKKSEMAVESTILRLKAPKNFKSPQIVTVDDNDGDLSDAGTVDFEGEDLSLENDNNNDEDVTPTEKETSLTIDTPRMVDSTINDVQHSTGASDEDVSEAETEILDDEPDADDLGLDYSDDSDSGGKPVSVSKVGTGTQKDDISTKSDDAKSEEKTTSESDSNGNSKEKQRSDKNEDKVDASKAGVQQFFDFKPLQLKPKSKTTTSTAPKPLPVHNYDETHAKTGNNDADFNKKVDPPEMGEVCQNGKIGDTDKQKISPYAEPSPGTLATFDDDGDNMFISDSDDDGNGLMKEVEDIRFDLDNVPVDESLLVRQVYVTGFNPTVCAEQIGEDFARFGVAVDPDTRFPAIDIFPCQRNHLGRGDACVTFNTEEGAQEAVEELNLKNVKNSMIRVRLMDAHTQRILTVQFQTVRDTWKCTGTQCRTDVSIWNAKCEKCSRKRVYGPSNIKIGTESWLCSLCFTANDSYATSCHGCMESLPEVDRSTFYS
ncbi:hypothetical protein PHMEG_0007772 [Phytophthora megakarya]|uniref:RRM domain-containing protein n=1 Tax=Phytophthora megakarya TaxID=4795 RepID=A0A225WMR1_9STRA|nr:hypothetical protein PHMEG_0007772 [Phytophthora megakarya]